MKPVNLRAGASALALILSATGASAQDLSALSGMMVPGCNDNVEAVDGATLGPDALTGLELNPLRGDLASQVEAGDICVNAGGKLRLKSEAQAEAEPQPAAEAEASAEGGAAVDSPLVAQPQEETPAEPETPQETADAPAAPAQGETAAAEGGSEGGAAVDSPLVMQPQEETPAEAETTQEAAEAPEAPAESETTAEGRAETEAPSSNNEGGAQPNPVFVEGGSDGRPAAAAAAEGDGEAAAEVEETTLTEENTRSSDEEFNTANQAASGSNDDGGLSNLGKFALGAAGIVALDAILGDDAEVVQNSGDRVVVRRDNGDLRVLRDDDTLLRRPGSQVRTETFADGSTRTTVTRPNGSQVVTVADASGRVIKRTRITVDGRRFVLIDDTESVDPVDVSRLPEPEPDRRVARVGDRDALRAALRAEAAGDLNRRFTLRQVRELAPVRYLMPEITVDSVNFRTGSAAIEPQEAEELFELGEVMAEFIADNPDELFLIEGHTDAVGDAIYNLALSDRRAESVALALTEYFNVPPENMIIQGYGESELLIPTDGPERANRRATVRRITPLLR